MIGMTENILDDVLWNAALAQDRRAVLRVLVKGRVDLPIEIVQQAADEGLGRRNARLSGDEFIGQQFSTAGHRHRVLPEFLAGEVAFVGLAVAAHGLENADGENGRQHQPMGTFQRCG